MSSEERTSSRRTNVDVTATISRADFVTPPPPAGPLVYSVSTSSPIRRASHRAVAARRDARAHLVRFSPWRVRARCHAARRAPPGPPAARDARTPVMRSRSATISSASRARATAPGPAYEICPSPTHPSRYPTDTLSMSWPLAPLDTFHEHAIGAHLGDRRARDVHDDVRRRVRAPDPASRTAAARCTCASSRRPPVSASFVITTTAVAGHLADRKAQPRESVDVLVARVGEVAASHLARALEQMARDRRRAQGASSRPAPSRARARAARGRATSRRRDR